MRRGRNALHWLLLAVLPACLSLPAPGQEGYWSLKKYFIGRASTLTTWLSAVDTRSGEAVLSGQDTSQPTTPFTFSWGDGQTTTGFFHQHHTYQDRTRNYVATVTAHYTDGTTDEAERIVFFVPPDVDPQPLPPSLSVTIPDHPVTLGSHVPNIPPPSLVPTHFDDGFFPVIPRATAEYVLTAGASVEEDFVNETHLLVDGAFRQVILREAGSGGAQAFWYSDPPSVASGDHELLPTVNWSVLYHELAHNFQLNSPLDACFGCFRVDGRGGYYMTEFLPRVMQCAVGFELLNDRERYGLGEDISADIADSTIHMAKEIRSHHEDYLRLGMRFCSYENPSTPERETYDTFCTLAARFMVHAEQQDLGYRVPTKRLMRLVQTFDQEAFDRWDSRNDTPEADAFRSTFLVTALSFAFQEDLRAEFRALSFPVSDPDYEALWQKADTDPADFALAVTPASLTVPRGRSVTCAVGTEALQGLTHEISFRARLATPIEGVSVSLSDRTVNPGGTVTITAAAGADAPVSTSSIRLQAEGEYTAHAADIPVTVVTVPVVSSATFEKKTLTIQGTDLGAGSKVLINGTDHSAQITSASSAAIELKGKKKKLGLHSGENRIVVIDAAGTESAEFALNL